VLRSQASRREFLGERGHRVRFVFLPKHTSWLNQIEIVFGMIMRN
jgi:transposase